MLRCTTNGAGAPTINRLAQGTFSAHGIQQLLLSAGRIRCARLQPIADPRGWLAQLAAPYRQAIPAPGLAELAVTALPFADPVARDVAQPRVGYWLTLLLAVPAAGFLVRLFVIQHDCGHGSFFHSRARQRPARAA